MQVCFYIKYDLVLWSSAALMVWCECILGGDGGGGLQTLYKETPHWPADSIRLLFAYDQLDNGYLHSWMLLWPASLLFFDLFKPLSVVG